jgi:hypothetical protein
MRPYVAPFDVSGETEPSTRSNSPRLPVMTMRPRLRAWPANQQVVAADRPPPAARASREYRRRDEPRRCRRAEPRAATRSFRPHVDWRRGGLGGGGGGGGGGGTARFPLRGKGRKSHPPGARRSPHFPFPPCAKIRRSSEMCEYEGPQGGPECAPFHSLRSAEAWC